MKTEKIVRHFKLITFYEVKKQGKLLQVTEDNSIINTVKEFAQVK